MRTAVLGGGLVGSQVLRQLVEEGEQPVLFDVAPQLGALGEIVDLERVTVVRGDVLDMTALVEAIRDVMKLRGEVRVVPPGTIPADAKRIDDRRTWE